MRLAAFLSCVLFASLLSSCKTLDDIATQGMAPMDTSRKKMLPPDAVAFDVLLIRVPYESRELARLFWNEVDEQEIPLDQREILRENGFRVGLIGASVPDSLSKLISLKGRPLRTSLEEEVTVVEKEAPMVVSKPVTLQRGHHSMIDTYKDVIPSIPILKWENDEIKGRSYTDVLPRLSVSTKAMPDGSVEFEITPVLQYGSPRLVNRYQYTQLVQSQEQPTKTFEELRTSMALRPGQFLVMGVSDEFATGLGHYYFTRGQGDMEQKLLVFRLLLTQHDDQFERFAGFQELAKESPDADKEEPEPDFSTLADPKRE